MSWMGITMDGTYYHVRVVYNTLFRTFELVEGPAAGSMLNAGRTRDLLGTGITYEMGIEPDPDYLDDYDAFWTAVSTPVNTHTITMPYNNSTITYDAEIAGGRDVYDGILSGRRRWKGLSIQYRWSVPQVEVT